MASNVSATTSGIKTKISADDTTADFLAAKLSAGTDITITTLNPGANESVEIKTTNSIQNFSFSKVSAMASKTIPTSQQMIYSGIFDIDDILDLQGELVLI